MAVEREELIERFSFWLTVVRQAIKIHSQLGPAGLAIDSMHSLRADAARQSINLAALSGPTLCRLEETYLSTIAELEGSTDELADRREQRVATVTTLPDRRSRRPIPS